MRLLMSLAALVSFSATACSEHAPTTQAGTTAEGPGGKETPSNLTLEALGRDFGPLIQKSPAGQIDWARGEVRAVGIGLARGAQASDAAMAKRAARLVAARNAILLMHGIEPGPAGRFADAPAAQITVEGVLKGLEEVSSAFDPKTRTARVTIRVPIHGVKGVVWIRQVVPNPPAPRWKPPAPAKDAQRIDAIIIDARGAPFTPCVYPRVLTASGECVLDGAHLRRDDPSRISRPLYVTHQPQGRAAGQDQGPPAALPGVLTFGKDGHRALVVRAAKAADGQSGASGASGAMVLRDEDVKALAACAGVERLLELGEVVIVTDPPAPEKPEDDPRSRE